MVDGLPRTRLRGRTARPAGGDEDDGDGGCGREDEGVESWFHDVEGTSFPTSGAAPGCGLPTVGYASCPGFARVPIVEAKSGENPALSRNCEALRG